jgi:hypothetical protein
MRPLLHLDHRLQLKKASAVVLRLRAARGDERPYGHLVENRMDARLARTPRPAPLVSLRLPQPTVGC